jgi:hypothetical protein
MYQDGLHCQRNYHYIERSDLRQRRGFTFSHVREGQSRGPKRGPQAQQPYLKRANRKSGRQCIRRSDRRQPQRQQGHRRLSIQVQKAFEA